MKRSVLNTVNHAIQWSEAEDTKREVKYEHGTDWAGKYFDRIYVYDNSTCQGAYIPIPFDKNISKYLCQQEQEKLQESLDLAKERMLKSVQACAEMED